MSQSIQPLRIQKNTPSSSPTKMNGVLQSRPLAELGPMERRRNSPSFNQNNKKSLINGDSSPFDSSPLAANSPRLYWQSRDPASPTRFSMENRNPLDGRESSPSPAKRSSIENLKRASRVKNSNMFARELKQEYDPASTPVIERPLASGRPLSVQPQRNSVGSKDFGSAQKDAKLLVYSPLKSPTRLQNIPEPELPTRGQQSPNKSSLSKNSRYTQQFDPENGMWSEDDESFADRQLPAGKSLHRHAKSVTFDAAPPQINEYEMTTPDPSSVTSGSREGSYDSADGEEDESFDRGSSLDHDDSFDASLEDTDKTPVVLPEDWRFMSPEIANHDLVSHIADPFDPEKSSPAPAANPMPLDVRSSPTRTDSINSNGERRPLPPLPALGLPMFARGRSDSNSSLMATAERIHSSQRVLPSPPRPASISKSDLQGMSGSSMPVEDRLRLMMIQDAENAKTAAEEQRERRMRRAGPRESSPKHDDSGLGIKIHEDEPEKKDAIDHEEYQMPPRISRESILRKIKSQSHQHEDSEHGFSSPALSPSPDREQISNVDPDTPLPSLEDGFAALAMEESIVIKQEEDIESEIDVYSIPEMYRHDIRAGSPTDPSSVYDSFVTSDTSIPERNHDDDDESHYSNDSSEGGHAYQTPLSQRAIEDDGVPTPRAQTPLHSDQLREQKANHRMSLPQFASMLGEDDFGLSFQSYMTPSPPIVEEPTKVATFEVPVQKKDLFQRPMTPEAQLDPPRFPGYSSTDEEEPRTPDSVIRHSIADRPVSDSPGIPEPAATIKAPGSGLKTRASLTPADSREMAQTRRQVSGQVPPTSPCPSNLERDPVSDADSLGPTSSENASSEAEPVKQIKRKSSLAQLEVPVEELDEGLSIGLDKEFERVIEAQKVAYNLSFANFDQFSSGLQFIEDIAGQEGKFSTQNHANSSNRTQKGYLMRQNTKMVVASSASTETATDAADGQDPHARGTKSAGNSPRKPSQQTWTTEPWNGKIRRKSIRHSVGSPQKRTTSGSVPPLPGQPSNVTSGLDCVNEDEVLPSLDDQEEGEERGRLFVKVVGIKELDLPLPRNERSYFALTLDNGLHCVTTSWLELGKFAPIGQEFELVVLNDLEFQLTLQTKIEEPKPKKIAESPIKPAKVQKQSTFSRVFASPKKRKELELKQQEEAQRAAKQRQLDAQASKRAAEPTAWDLLHNLVAKDGSFARSYICLKDHESQAYGRPYTVDVPCFNEWAMEEARSMGSGRSSRGLSTGMMQRKAPYKIGKLELQLLYIPKPKGAREEDMPKSMNACIRELQDAENATEKSWEGHLSQQGGDCPYWRRRFFRLDGSKLTAYHEATRQPRATINLAKASKLIDDKSSLIQKEVSGKGGSRRKSAFAAEEEGYMFVEEGFRVRFANGETIDFYADSAAEKDGWMKVLAHVVGKEVKQSKTWTDLIIAKHRAMAQKTARLGPGPNTKMPAPGARSAPTSPRKPSHQKRPSSGVPAPPPPLEKDSRHAEMADARRAKTRSMIF